MRKALELSMTTAPAATACGAHNLEVEPPAEANTRSTLSNDRPETASTGSISPPKGRVVPAERSEASSFKLEIGKLLLCKSSSNSAPTAPGGPKTAHRHGRARHSRSP